MDTIPGPPMEKELFHHVWTLTIKDLATDSSPVSFWYNHALPLAHTVKPIRHALCAFAAAHRSFLSTDCQPRSGTMGLAIQHYNTAIQHIMPLMASPAPENIDTILVCCVIFTTLENLFGRYSDSVRHLRAGWQLLESYQPVDTRPSNSNDSDTQLFNDVAGMMSRLSLDTSIYVGDDVVPSHGSFLRPLLSMGDPGIPFASAADAEQYLHDFDLVYSSYVSSYFTACESTDSGSNNSSITPSTPFAGPEINFQTLSAIFYQWLDRFTLLAGELQKRETSDQEQYRVKVLSLHAVVWTALVKLDEDQGDIEIQDCMSILEMAESLIPSISCSEERPIFTFSADLIPPLTLVGLSCKDDIAIQQRTLDLLRSMHRRESVWDSHEVAEILEGMYSARSSGFLTDEMIPWGLSNLAKLLSRSFVPSVSPNNGALSLAKSEVQWTPHQPS